MKNLVLLFFSFLALSYGTVLAQDTYPEHDEKIHAYPTINLIIGNPVQEFWSNYSKQTLWGFNVDGVIAPFKNARFIEPGLQFEIFPGASQKDSWQGIEVSSSSTIARLNAITRFRIAKQSKIKPYLELGYGLNMTSTRTKYEIVDEVTFFEKFFLDEEDNVETVEVKDFQDYGQNLYAGIGFMLYDWVNVQIKYNYSPTIKFVQKEDIVVSDNAIDYGITSSKMQMVVVSVGVSFDKLLQSLK